MRISPRRLGLVALLAGVASLGCNSLFGIEEGQLAEAAATSGATTATTATTSSTSSTSTSSTTTGGGGSGGSGGGTGGSGQGGQGGGTPCGYYDGYADLNVTSDSVGAFLIVASESISGTYDASRDLVEFSIGAGQISPFCDVGVRLWLAGGLAVGTYNATTTSPDTDLVAFGAGMNAYSTFEVSQDEVPCDGSPAGSSRWTSVSGTWSVTAINGLNVELHADNVAHAPAPATPTATGTVTLDGDIHDGCFYTP